ncbi:hypothetical protein BKA70DRAFT_1460401 [Coprinopsis sp. MPI-PUGE-AT-0042]|nr:hypothetical protein BKA70DRAFT_1460401 [Coprinopsis sp. MPI-PUGE-AT-0042]
MSLLGISRLSVDEAGATDYVYSKAISYFISAGPSADVQSVLTRTIKADATRVFQAVKETTPGGMVIEDLYECVHHSNGTSVCWNRRVLDRGGSDLGESATVTLIDVTRTGTPTPWATIKGIESALPTSVGSALPTNIESALPTGDDEGGVNPTLRGASLVGYIVATLGVGITLALI